MKVRAEYDKYFGKVNLAPRIPYEEMTESCWRRYWLNRERINALLKYTKEIGVKNALMYMPWIKF